MIHRCQEFVVPAGGPLMFDLFRRHQTMTTVCCGFLRGGRSRGCSTPSAIVTNIASPPWEAPHVSVVNHRNIYVIYRPIVVERSIIPISAPIADTAIAVAIVDASVEADSGTPVPAFQTYRHWPIPNSPGSIAARQRAAGPMCQVPSSSLRDHRPSNRVTTNNHSAGN